VQPKVQYLGHIVPRKGIHPSPEKIKAVKNYLIPKTVKEVQSFLGLASFYRRLIPKFAETAKSPTELTRKVEKIECKTQ
jgi:hypothetical protein